jgi:hypothetical protein
VKEDVMPRFLFDEFREHKDSQIHHQLHSKFSGWSRAKFYLRKWNWHVSEELNRMLWNTISEKNSAFHGNSFSDFRSWVNTLAARILWSYGTPPKTHRLTNNTEDEKKILALGLLGQADQDILLFTFRERFSRGEIAALFDSTRNDVDMRLKMALLNYARVLRFFGVDMPKEPHPGLLGQALRLAFATLECAA